MNLPDEIIEKIMHFAGAYLYNKKLRPYIEDIKRIRNIIEEHSVKRSLILKFHSYRCWEGNFCPRF